MNREGGDRGAKGSRNGRPADESRSDVDTRPALDPGDATCTVDTLDPLGRENDDPTDAFQRIDDDGSSPTAPPSAIPDDNGKTQMVNLKDVYQGREQNPNRVLSGATAVVRLADVEKRMDEVAQREAKQSRRRDKESRSRQQSTPEGMLQKGRRTSPPPPVPRTAKQRASKSGNHPKENRRPASIETRDSRTGTRKNRADGESSGRRDKTSVTPKTHDHSEERSPQPVRSEARNPVKAGRERSSVQIDFTPSEEHPLSPATAGRAKTIVFFGPKGGVGATLLSVNIGAMLAKMGLKTVILDMDLQLGTVPFLLGCDSARSIAELMKEAERSAGKPLSSGLDRHPSGLAFAAQSKIEELGEITAARVPRLFDALSGGFDYILVDGLRDFSDHAITVMDLADRVVMVVTQDVPAVRSAARALSVFGQLGYPTEQVSVVINRYCKKSAVPPENITRVLGREIDAYLANDLSLVESAVNDGRLLDEVKASAPLVMNLRSLAGALADRPEEPKKAGLISRLLGRN